MMSSLKNLSSINVNSRLAEADGWSLTRLGEITKTYQFSGFLQALLFCNAVGLLAEAANHHPDILIQWNKVTLTLMTHDTKGLTDRDFNLAIQIDRLP